MKTTLSIVSLFLVSIGTLFAQTASENMTIIDMSAHIHTGITEFDPIKPKTIIGGQIDTLCRIGIEVNDNNYSFSYLKELELVAPHKFEQLDPNYFEWIKLVKRSNGISGGFTIDSINHPTGSIRFSNVSLALPAREKMVWDVVVKVRVFQNIGTFLNVGFFSITRCIMQRANGELLRNQLFMEDISEIKRSFVPTDPSEKPVAGVYYISSPSGDKMAIIQSVDSVTSGNTKLSATWINGGAKNGNTNLFLTNAYRMTRMGFGTDVQRGMRNATLPFSRNDLVYYQLFDSTSGYTSGYARVVNSLVSIGNPSNTILLDDGTVMNDSMDMMINLSYLYDIRSVSKRIQETAPIVRFAGKSTDIVLATVGSDIIVDTLIIKSPLLPGIPITISRMEPRIERVGDYFSNWNQEIWYEDKFKRKISLNSNFDLLTPITIPPGDSLVLIAKTNTNDQTTINQLRNNSKAYFQHLFYGNPDSSYITGDIGYFYSINNGTRVSTAILGGYNVIGKKHEFTSTSLLGGNKEINTFFIKSMEWKSVTDQGAILRLDVRNFIGNNEPIAIALKLKRNRFESEERIAIGYGSFENEYLTPYTLSRDQRTIDIPIKWSDFFLKTFLEDTISFTRFDMYDISDTPSKIQDLIYDGRAKTLVIKNTNPILYWQAVPNPFIDDLKLIIETASQITIEFVIISLIGQTVATFDVLVPIGRSEAPILFPRVSSGIYIIRARIKTSPYHGVQKTFKITKLRNN